MPLSTSLRGALRSLLRRHPAARPAQAPATDHPVSDALAPPRFRPEERASGEAAMRGPNGELTRVLRIADEPVVPPGRVWGCIRPESPAEPYMRPYALDDERWAECSVVLMNAQDFDVIGATIRTEREQEQARLDGTRAAYAAGQVWAYAHRPEDAGSLVRIGAIEDGPDGEPVYHVGVIGLRRPDGGETVLPHLPMSGAALDRSLLALTESEAAFPDPVPGIAIWKENEGAAWSLPIANIVAQAAANGMLV